MFLRASNRVSNSNKDRWLLTYADFITLLFATFVLMYAIARTKEGTIPGPHSAVANAGKAVQSNLLTDLQKDLHAEQESALASVYVDQRGIVIALNDRSCFRPGQAQVETAAVPMFEKIASILANYGNRVLLEGHTDSLPIHTAQFRSNWELSTARSIAVMELMASAGSLRTDRFLIGGSADNAPVNENQTEQGRAHNRRVEIIVLDSSPSDQASAEHPIAAVSSRSSW